VDRDADRGVPERDQRDPGVDDLGDDMPSVADVKKRLEQLFLWGNLSQDYDTTRATSLESYEKSAYEYDLTLTSGTAASEQTTRQMCRQMILLRHPPYPT